MLELLQIFVDNIAPILIIALAGFVIGRQFDIQPKPISTLIYYLLSPSLVFVLLYNSDIDGGEFAALFGGTVLFQVAMLTLAFGVLRLQSVSAVQRSNVMLSAFCLNAGNFGLSLVGFAFDEAVLSRAAVVFIANVSLNYTLGVYVASNGRSSPVQAFGNVLKTPAVYAVIAAFLLRTLQVEMPLVLLRPVERVADAAIPMMLITLGLQLGAMTHLSRLRLVFTGVSLKLLVAPFVAIAIAAILALTGDARTAFIIQASMPTAVLTLIFSIEFELDRDLALSLVLISTLLSPLTLSVLILLLR
jgi:malate permease and related proteins